MSISREFLLLVQESAFKTPVTTPIIWPTTSYNSFYIRLDGQNAFAMRPRPVQIPVPYGGGVNIENERVADKWVCEGALRVMLYPSLAAFLLGWAGTRINSGQTLPWVTTEPPLDLASVACYHGIMDSSGTIKRRAYLGTKVMSWNLTGGENSPIWMLTLGLRASTPQGNTLDSSTDPDATALPVPTDSQLPTGPYMFYHAGTSGAGLTIATSRTKFQTLTINSTIDIIPRFWTSRFAQIMRMTGRSTTLTAEQLMAVGTGDDRYEYENLVKQNPVTFKIDNGTHSVSIAMGASSVFTAVEDMLPQNDLYLQRTEIHNMWDASAGTDFAWTFA